MVKTFVFIGCPGSGKGVQSKLLSEKLGCQIFSTGKKVREIAESNTALGRRIKEISEAGNLTPFWFASYLFEQVLFNLNETDSIVFEGVGRTLGEAKLFNEVNECLNRDFRAIFLDVKEESVRDRIKKRQEVEGRADDHNFEHRYERFKIETIPALDHFRTLGKVIDINGEPAPEVIASEIWAKVSVL